MSRVESIREMVNLWPTRAALVGDLKSAFPNLPISVMQVHKWAEKQSIPARYHHPILIVARKRGFEITADLIVRLHSASRRGAA